MRDDQTVTSLFCSAPLYTIRHIRRYVKREMKKLIRLFYQTSYSADKKTLAIKTKMCYIIDIIRKQPPTKWLTSRLGYKPARTGQVQGRLIIYFRLLFLLSK